MTQNQDIYEGIKDFYRQRIGEAGSGASSCCSAGAKAGGGLASAIGYTEEDLDAVPVDAAGASFGCGNPLAFSEVREGETVLDLGSGAGIDCFIASAKVGTQGRVIGLDMTEEMIAEARRNAASGGYANVEFVLGRNEDMPVESSSVDWVISNCVINLSPEKDKVFSEAFRVLKPGGRLLISDIVADDVPESMRADISSWAACVSGAVSEDEYLGLIRGAGFEDVSIVDRVDYRKRGGPGSMTLSSIRVRATRKAGRMADSTGGPGAGKEGGRVEDGGSSSDREESMDGKSAKATSPVGKEILDEETQLLIAIGSAVAAGCVPCLETLAEKAREAGISQKKQRAAAMTGQFIKDKPAAQMKALSDSLLGTHMASASDKAPVCCPTGPEGGQEASGTAGPAGGCGCG